MDNLGQIEAFVRTADARSFTVAAHQPGISSSAVGKAVPRLEERFQVQGEALDRALAYIASHDDVWLTTSHDIAAAYTAQVGRNPASDTIDRSAATSRSHCSTL